MATPTVVTDETFNSEVLKADKPTLVDFWAGDEIRKGQEIAEVCDVFGDVVEKIVAPADGIARII